MIQTFLKCRNSVKENNNSEDFREFDFYVGKMTYLWRTLTS